MFTELIAMFFIVAAAAKGSAPMKTVAEEMEGLNVGAEVTLRDGRTFRKTVQGYEEIKVA